MILDHIAFDITKNPNTRNMKRYIGKVTIILRTCDIDRSGRGYIFPHAYKVTHVKNRNVWTDTDCFLLRSIIEIGLPLNTKN